MKKRTLTMKPAVDTPTIEQLQPLLKRLRLSAIAQTLLNQINDPETANRPYLSLLKEILEAEVLRRDSSALQRRIQEASLKYPQACLAEIDYKTPRGLKRAQIEGLGNNDWIRAHHNIICTGATGSGKTYLVCAIVNAALCNGFTAKFVRFPKLLKEFYTSQSLANGFDKVLKEMRKPDVLIIDDWGIGEVNAAARTDLLELIEARTGTGSTIITSVLPVEKWSEYIGDPTVADSILDRLVRVSHRIKVNSKESMREQKKYGAVKG